MAETQKEKIQIIQEKCRTDLRFLCRNVLGMNDWGKVHDDVARFLSRPHKRKHVELARGHLKSSIITKGWTIQRVLNNPDIRILLANATWDNSRKFLRTIQKYLTHGSPLQAVFGPFVSEHWNQDECTIRQRKKILDAPTWATTGLEKEQTSQHYDLIIADDLVARENVSTPEQRQKVKTYYRDLLDLLEPDGTLVVIGTRWHQDDLYAELLADPGFDCFIRTAYTDETKSAVTFPEKFSLEYLQSLRNSKGAYEFSAQYLNNPIDESAADFKKEWIHYYDPTTPHPSNLLLTVDPALSLSRDADYTAMAVTGMFSNRKIRLVDRVHARMVPSDLVSKVFELVKKWKLHRVVIETFAFQKTLRYDIERRQRESGVFFKIDEFKQNRRTGSEPGSLKQARIRRLQPYFEQGLIEIRQDMQDVEDELLQFPRGRHDDLIDALSMALDFLYPAPADTHVKEVREGTMGALLQKTWNTQPQGLYAAFLRDIREAPKNPF